MNYFTSNYSRSINLTYNVISIEIEIWCYYIRIYYFDPQNIAKKAAPAVWIPDYALVQMKRLKVKGLDKNLNWGQKQKYLI